MTIKETKKIIQEIEEFDYGNFDNLSYHFLKEQIDRLFMGEFNMLTPIRQTKDLRVFRCRPNEEKKVYTEVGEVWHPPAEKTPMGRLNFKNIPIMYTAQNAATAMIEINAHKLKYFTVVEFGFSIESFSSIDLGTKIVSESKRNQLDDRTKIIMEFLYRQAKKIVPEDKPQYYCPMMIFATSISNNPIDAYMYESVAAFYKGLNFAFKPKFASKYMFPIEVRFLEVVESINSNMFKVKCLRKSKKIGKGLDGIIEWEEAKNCRGHNIDSNEFTYH